MHFLIFAFLFLCSCERLSVHTDYVSIENLASYHVRTPDPLLNNPPVGQRLLATWRLTKSEMDLEDLHLQITIRFGNREQIVQNVPICKIRGTYIYSLLNEDYYKKEGILTYKVELLSGTTVLETWVHQLWTELIEL